MISLNDTEQQLFDNIDWDIDHLYEQKHNVIKETLQKVGKLTKSLFDRKAIPSCRMDWFEKKELFIGGHGKSRKERFIENVQSFENVITNPYFIKYLHYFIFGPHLPKETIDGFVKVLKSDRDISDFVRNEIKEKNLFYSNTRYVPADEFFKLALEVKYPHPEIIYKAAKSVKR